MRRFVTLLVLLLVSVPFGISMSGCGKKNPVVFCNASSGDGGVVVGQLNSIVLQPLTYGISLNYGQIGQLTTPQGTDCKGTAVSVSAFTYGSRNVSIVDVNPANGALCAGTWNRSLNVIPDFTVCTPPTNPNASNSMTYLTAEANGVTSNPIPVFTHPVVTSIVLGAPTADCTTDPTSNCCPLASANTITATPYNGTACLSQGSTGQLVARVFAGAGTASSNISCQAGHLTFAAQTAGIVAIDQNGVATAQQPGSTVITASVSNAGSSAGFFSTCPPTSIKLNVPNTTATNITVNQNFAQPLVATVLDQNNTVLTGLALEYVSTTPTTIPAAAGGIITPSFPGGASITAICQPPTCNPSPFNQIGFLGNGKPATSNPIGITTPGANSTLLYLASTQSRYLVPVDFTTTTLGAPVQLPYVPNSMVISVDGTSIYMGSSTELMVVSATTDGVTREDVSVPGTVLAVSPDNATVVIADPIKKLIYLEAAAGGVITQFGGIGTHAQWTPDSQTVYITAGDQLLVYSTFTGWNNITPTSPSPNPTAGNTPLDVAVTVPSVGAYFAGATTRAVTYCPSSTLSTTNGQTTVANVFNPQADQVTTATDRIAATNDGRHIIGAAASTGLLSDLQVTLPAQQCPLATQQFSTGGTSTPFTTTALTGIVPVTITGVFPTSDSTAAVVTYTGTGGVLPAYAPAVAGTATPGALTNIKLSGTATAPVAGVWSTDNFTFYAGTSGDNLVHLITRPAAGSTLTDSKTIAPNLPLAPNTGGTGTIAIPNLMVQKPRKTT
ncbi:hypothetical protein [Granulicella arctica]|uniref:hypothetical protein n=1 Tax=Granulicella arctica TaxID=940613 RepID=UPI0021DF852E|nr:hypothetical protein [Granulicella arctica]